MTDLCVSYIWIINFFCYSFSFVAPCLLENGTVAKKSEAPQKSLGTAPGNFFDEYILMDVLGRGSYSVCRLARHRATGQQYAVKVNNRLCGLSFVFILSFCLQIIDKSKCDCKEEVEILLRYGHHPGIVSLKNVHEVAGNIFLVLQLLRGGDLLDYMMAKVCFCFCSSLAFCNKQLCIFNNHLICF